MSGLLNPFQIHSNSQQPKITIPMSKMAAQRMKRENIPACYIPEEPPKSD
jgi:hypothetical protein